jgi:peptidoglycan/LPS O-acetylase OafA/YrhL
VDECAQGTAPAVFSWRPVTYVGATSYGIYLFHLPIARGIEAVHVTGLSGRGTDGSFVYFLLVAMLTIAAAALSWRLFERCAPPRPNPLRTRTCA